MKVKEQQELRETVETWLISKVYACSKGHGDKFRQFSRDNARNLKGSNAGKMDLAGSHFMIRWEKALAEAKSG